MDGGIIGVVGRKMVSFNADYDGAKLFFAACNRDFLPLCNCHIKVASELHL